MTEIEVGDIIQLDPVKTANRAFRGCLAVVRELTEDGKVLCHVQTVGESRESEGMPRHHYADPGTFEPTGGKAVWIIE